MRCQDIGFYYVDRKYGIPIQQGTQIDRAKHAMMRCNCVTEAFFKRTIPAEFYPAILNDLKPFWDGRDGYQDVRKYAEILSAIKVSPMADYLICGSYGVGKSHLGWSLWRYGVEHSRKSFYFTAIDLLEQYRAEDFAWKKDEEAPKAEVTATDIRNDRSYYTIVIDEFDSPSVTQYQAQKMSELINTIYECSDRVQLVVISNFKPDQLLDKWSNNGGAYGAKIMRRINHLCTYVDLFR